MYFPDIYCCFQIGDLLMCYILRHSSIFLPVKKSTFFQVTGLPLNVLLQKPISTSTMGKNQRPQSTEQRCPMVRNYWFVWHSFSFEIHAWWFRYVSNTKSNNCSTMYLQYGCSKNLELVMINSRNSWCWSCAKQALCSCIVW